MKKIRATALIVMLVLIVFFVVGCSSAKNKNLFSDWSAEDIAQIELKIIPDLNPNLESAPLWKTLTEKEDIEAFVKYLQKATIVKTKTMGLSGGWTYAFTVTDTKGETTQCTFDTDSLRFNSGDNEQTIYTFSEHHFKPLILMMVG